MPDMDPALPERVATPFGQPLHGIKATRAMEQSGASLLPAHTLMQRAGLAVARLAMAVAPHARTVWIAAGPGNNGGDGIEAGIHLKAWGRDVRLTWLGQPDTAPSESQGAWRRASSAGLLLHDGPAPRMHARDLCIDALLGMGATRSPEGALASCIEALNTSSAPTLAIDLPSGLHPEAGQTLGSVTVAARWTLSLLSLKPGLFTGRGRDLAGEIWFCGLGVKPDSADAMLGARPSGRARPHASHKGSYGDIFVIGGAPGMGGAAVLAAAAALHGGAGRVLAGLLDAGAPALIAAHPELMVRRPDDSVFERATVVCGCGGGDAIGEHLPRLLARAPRLVLDADALNALARDLSLQQLLAARGQRIDLPDSVVITPHPLEAARLLDTNAVSVQQDRMAAAMGLSKRFSCTVVLKGSGSVIAAPAHVPVINPTGNARLATAGSGDVLAGMIGARLAGTGSAFQAACDAVYRHGELADQWPANEPLTAGALARACI